MVRIDETTGLSKVFGVIGKSYQRVPKLMSLVSGIAVALLMIWVTIDVIRRGFFSQTLPATAELSVIAMIFIVYWAFADVQIQGKNLLMDFVARRFSPRGQALLNSLNALIGLFLFGLITWQAWGWSVQAWQTGERMEGVARIGYFPARIALTIGAFVLCVQFIIDFIRCARTVCTAQEEVQPTCNQN